MIVADVFRWLFIQPFCVHPRKYEFSKTIFGDPYMRCPRCKAVWIGADEPRNLRMWWAEWKPWDRQGKHRV